MGSHQRFTDVGDDRRRLAPGERAPALEATLQGLALEEVHHEPGRTVVLADGMHLRDVGVDESTRRLDLSLEARTEPGVVRGLGQDDLERPCRPALEVAHAEHRAHAAVPEQRLHEPAPVDRLADQGVDRRRRRAPARAQRARTRGRDDRVGAEDREALLGEHAEGARVEGALARLVHLAAQPLGGLVEATRRGGRAPRRAGGASPRARSRAAAPALRGHRGCSEAATLKRVMARRRARLP